MVNINEVVGMKNCLDISGVNKRLVCPFRRQYLWKFIGCILQALTYGKKGHNIWSEIPKSLGKKPRTKLRRYVFENTYLNNLCCDLYSPYCCYDCH